MRHVRMLGLCLAALFIMSAVFAGSAVAKKSNIWQRFAACPLGTPPAPDVPETYGCISGEAGPESFFQAGKVTVHFKKPIVLTGGYAFIEEENGAEKEVFVGARYGQTISREAEPAPSLTENMDAEALPEPEKARYEAYIAKAGSTKVTATIELAKPAVDIGVDENNLILESNEPAFVFPVEIHLTNKFLGKDCYDGNWEQPIEVPFTSGETSPPPPTAPIHGSKGSLTIAEEAIATLTGAVLVNNSYAAPGVQGCGVNGGADSGLDAGMGLPSPAGSNVSELIGNLFAVNHAPVEEHVQQ